MGVDLNVRRDGRVVGRIRAFLEDSRERTEHERLEVYGETLGIILRSTKPLMTTAKKWRERWIDIPIDRLLHD